MNRRYTASEYENILNQLRSNIKTVSITTDIIVGFPGETDEEFNKTYEFLNRIKLSKMHVFKYSPRSGTRAASMKDQIDGNVKEYRSSKIINLDKIFEEQFRNKFLGNDMNVLYEKKLNNSEDLYEGYTPNYIKIVTKCHKNIEGSIIKTRIIDSENGYLIGKIL
jgi:threonylcarbamoyladenosine tRNA methylthiotransferase MtaB